MAKAEKTRQYIVEKAASLFNSKGFAGTSMDDIVKATGLSKGGVYGNFSSKEAIALSAFEHAVQRVSREVRQRTRGIGQALDKLRAVVYFYKERILDPPIEGGCPIQNTAIDADDSNPALRSRVIAALDDWQQRIVYTLEKGKERGEVLPSADSRAFAVRFIGTLEGGIMLAQLYKDVRYFDAMAEQLLDMIEGLRAG
ncbi:MAG: TetR/AcrR family transcriptional regulator [Phaeodactylibacter sp.]|nr:TetR/AcrR family transcriptional regulator [Phaeodactylibacter sp.]MCB9263474.1 TetR/AcrR family transcriptional regulator [Lewinellaceae bacterium]MCB9298887.1 TetR/AcrR family transcriptional regulator [Lewinellaceae bacterium]